EQRLDMLEAIDSDADRLTRLITDLLDVSRIDAGRLRIHEVPLSTRDILKRHVERHVAAGQAEQDFTITVAPDAEELYADADRVDQVMSNLLENAVRHRASKVHLDASHLKDPSGSGVLLSVSDDGLGVPAE